MAIQTTTVKIENVEYVISHMPTTKALAFFRKLSDLLGDGMAPLVGVLMGDDDAMGPLIQALLSKFSEVEVENLIKTLVQDTVFISGMHLTDDAYENNFAGAFDVLIRLVVECLKHNYSSFLKIGAIEVVTEGQQPPR